MGGGWQMDVCGQWEEQFEYDASYWPSRIGMVLCRVGSNAKKTLQYSE
jgi:hypothetical protein